MERILASSVLGRARKPAKLLRYIVEHDLDGPPPLDEYTIGLRVFDRRENWIPQEDAIVRENMRRLRRLVDQYYATEGAEDWLRLEFTAYESVFSFNPASRFEQHYRRALHHLSSDPKSAFSLLNAALSIKPDHAGALAAWAETELWRPLYGYDAMVPQILSAAEHSAQRALQSDKKHWRAHLVIGAIHCCRHAWGSARKSFRAALKHSPADTTSHPWYAALLMALGKTRESLELVRAKSHEDSSDPWTHVTLATFLYAARKYQEAKESLRRALRLDPDHWLGNVIWSCVCLAQGDRQASVPGRGMAGNPHLPEGALVYPAVRIPWDIHEVPPDHPEYDLITGAMHDIARRKLAGWEPPDDIDHYRAIGEPFLTPCQVAIGYMAIGEADRAIALLCRDADRNHPLLTWLHLWPIFDPLRTNSDFDKLVRRIRPSRRSVRR